MFPESTQLDVTNRLARLLMWQIGEARMKLGKLHSELDRRRNYVRICDLKEDRYEDTT